MDYKAIFLLFGKGNYCLAYLPPLKGEVDFRSQTEKTEGF